MDQAAVTCRFVKMVPSLLNSVYHNCIMFDLADITIQYNPVSLVKGEIVSLKANPSELEVTKTE